MADTPRRSIRVGDEQWKRWEQRAKDAGDEDVSAYVRRRCDEPESASRREVAALERELAELRSQTAARLEEIVADLRDE